MRFTIDLDGSAKISKDSIPGACHKSMGQELIAQVLGRLDILANEIAGPLALPNRPVVMELVSKLSLIHI